jgi:alcohol dehydrogenase
MKITGAVLEQVGAPAPWSTSRPITVRELELGEPGPHELLVRIEAAGVCHSDLSVVNGVRPRAVPLLLGHEAAGIVEAKGAEVADVVVGDRVAMTFLPRCGECASCLSGGRTPCEPGSAANGSGRLLDGGKRIHDGDRTIDHHLGVSGFATHAVVDHRSVVAVGADVPAPVAAIMGCAVLTGGGAVLNAAEVQPGESVAIVGLGGVGMAALLVALAIDGVEVTAVDANADKLATALELGATRALSPADALAADIEVAAAIEAVGRAAAFETAVSLTAPGGRTVTVGLPAPDDLASVSVLGLVAEGRRMIGSYLGSSIPSRDIPRFVEMWRAGRLPIERLMSSEIALDELNEAMDALEAGRALRQMIIFEKETA